MVPMPKLLSSHKVDLRCYLCTQLHFSSLNSLATNQQHCCIVATEEVKNQMKSKSGMLMKEDFEKAFDSVDGNFLLEIIQARGFGPRWGGWIRTILFSSKSKFLINGILTGFIRHKRGLRQGDPLSPLMFTLTGYLHHNGDDSRSGRTFWGFQNWNGSKRPNTIIALRR